MEAAPYRRWLPVLIVVAIAYVVIGRGSAAYPARTVQIRTFWRLAAFVASGIAFLVHIWYEWFRVRSAPMVTAMHTAAAVALGAFGLAALIHSPTPSHRHLVRIALVVWPLITGIPAFIAALILTFVLRRQRS